MLCLLFSCMIHSLSAEINYISFWWTESNIDISGTLEITVPWNETVSYQCSLSDPGEGAQIVILSVFFWYHECNTTDPSSPDIQIISPPSNEVNRIIVRYKGDTSFTIDGIHWIDNVEHRIDEFCIPQNHFYWASESGITECSDFDDDFSVDNPSMTIYIDYEWDRYETLFDFGDYYNGFISPAFISNISITARTFSGCNVDKTTLRLYWGRNIYECTIWLNSTVMTHSCNDTKLELVQSNCTQRAFAVGVTTEGHSGFAIEAISLVDEDGNIQTMATAACFDRAVIVDFSTVWKGNVIDFYPLDTDTDSMCFDFTNNITAVECPTQEPSQNANTSSVIYSDFSSSVTAFYRIINWTDSEISDVNEDVELFITSLTTFIYQGFDDDAILQHEDIVLNITFINDYAYDDFISGTVSKRKDILDLSMSNGMELEYLIECSHHSVCEYIAANSDSASVGMDSAVFEVFVTSKLQSYFNDYCTSTNTTHDGSDSALVFVVDNITTSASHTDQLPIFIILLIGGGLCLFISGVSVGVILYHRKRHRSTDKLCISNALVAMISIGDYANGVKISRRNKDVEGLYQDLPVEKDAETLQNLCKYMNWTFISKRDDVKTHWTEKEVMEFLEEDIGQKMFDKDGKSNFNGLIVCVSCHGMQDKIVTSDMKTIERTVIHRTLSLKYPQLRDIPRIFVFDCCDGWDERRDSIKGKEISKDIVLGMMDEAQRRKGTDLSDVQNMSTNAWTSTTKNPDYNMVTVYAANSGFVAKMNYNGSYLVYSLTDAIMENVERKQEKTLGELLEDVQNRLHDAGSQLPVNILNNHTRTLIFKKNVQK